MGSSYTTSAKTYLASGTPLLRQDTRYSNFAPLTLGAPRAGLPPSLAPGESGGTLAIQPYPRRYWLHNLTPDATGYTTLHPMLPDAAHNTIASPDAPLIHSTFRVPLEYDPYLFPAISSTWKGGTLGKNDWVIMGAK